MAKSRQRRTEGGALSSYQIEEGYCKPDFVLGVHQEVLDGIASFEIHFNPMFSADVSAALTHALDVWDHYVRLVATVCLICVFACHLICTGLLILFNACPG